MTSTLVSTLVMERITHIQEEPRVLKENRQMLGALTEPYLPTVAYPPKEVISVSATSSRGSQTGDV
jgi:hypothetical protein